MFRIFYVAVCAAFLGLCAVSLNAQDSNENSVFNALEKAKLRIFEALYKDKLDTDAKKREFLNTHYEHSSEHDIYTFPNTNIESAYNAYIKASEDENSIWAAHLERELPKTSKAYKLEPTKKDPNGYVISYEWKNKNKKLVVTNIGLQNDKECAKEVLDIEQKSSDVVLKSNYEQYCF